MSETDNPQDAAAAEDGPANSSGSSASAGAAPAPPAAAAAANGVRAGEGAPGFLDLISVRVSVELGAARVRLRDLMALEEGGIVDLDAQLDEPLSIYANGTLLGRGEVVRSGSGSGVGIRVTEISAAEQRLHQTRSA